MHFAQIKGAVSDKFIQIISGDPAHHVWKAFANLLLAVAGNTADLAVDLTFEIVLCGAAVVFVIVDGSENRRCTIGKDHF